MSVLIDVVKCGKRANEPFAPTKLHTSIVVSCRSVRTPEAVAHHAADMVCTHVLQWATDKPEVTAADIRRQASLALERFQPDAAYVYQHYKHII